MFYFILFPINNIYKCEIIYEGPESRGGSRVGLDLDLLSFSFFGSLSFDLVLGSLI